MEVMLGRGNNMVTHIESLFPYILGVLLPISESGKRPSSMNTRLLQMGLNLAASLTQDKWIVIYHASENFNLRSQAKFNDEVADRRF